MNNNQTCIHEGVAPFNLNENLHPNKDNQKSFHCIICAYEVGFLTGCSGKWRDFNEYNNKNTTRVTCIKGNSIHLKDFKNIEKSISSFRINSCIYCAFRMGFEAANIDLNLGNIFLEEVEPPNSIYFHLKL